MVARFRLEEVPDLERSTASSCHSVTSALTKNLIPRLKRQIRQLSQLPVRTNCLKTQCHISSGLTCFTSRILMRMQMT